MASSIQFLYPTIFLVIITISFCIGRPAENQDAIDGQQSSALSDLQKYYASYHLQGPGGYVNTDEINPLERLEMQYVKNQLYGGGYNGIGINGGGNNGIPSTYWNQLIRLPEMKRQVRYRQCYFNPISCFKK